MYITNIEKTLSCYKIVYFNKLTYELFQKGDKYVFLGQKYVLGGKNFTSKFAFGIFFKTGLNRVFKTQQPSEFVCAGIEL